MRIRILAGATALVLATSMTIGAMAFDHRSRTVATGGMHGFNANRGNQFVGVHGHHGRRLIGDYGSRNASPYYGGRYYTDLGPLGFTLGPPPGHGYCGPNCVPGSSIAAWSY
jgi:hypothetical protein